MDGIFTIFAAMKSRLYILSIAILSLFISCEDQGLTPVTFLKSISISSGDTTINLGTNPILEVISNPTSATNARVEWHSSDSTVMYVDVEGMVTTVSAGEALVTITSLENPNIQDNAIFNVIIPVESVTIDTTDFSMDIDAQVTLRTDILPASATNISLEWSSSDEEVATVSTLGSVTAVAKGSATITAKSVSNPDISDSVVVTVNETVPPVE